MARHVPTVLLVDDHQDTLDMYKLYLSGSGFRVLTAGDVQTALLLAMEEHPAAIVTDLVLEGRDGFALIAAIRVDSRTRRIPILVLSGLPGAAINRQLAGLHVAQVLMKPVLPDSLCAHLHGVLAA